MNTKELRDLFFRIVVNGEDEEPPDPAIEARTEASYQRVMRRIRRRKVLRRVLGAAIVLLLTIGAGTAAYACAGEGHPFAAEEYVIVATSGHGSRCERMEVFGVFRSYDDAEAWSLKHLGKSTYTHRRVVRQLDRIPPK